jgi:D-3-phosphoglycerate dehydrogenase
VIVIPDDYPVVMAAGSAWQQFHRNHQVRYFDTLPGGDERLIERIRDAEVVINIRSSVRFTEAVLAACPNLQLISIWGTGTDNVDLEAARRRGVTVTNTPGVAARSIAEHSLALTFAVARRIPQVDGSVRAGQWIRGNSVQLSGKTLGIIGLGAIGREFARLGSAVGMRVTAWTMHPKPELGFPLVSLETLYRESDVVSLHLRLSEETRGMVGASQFAMMKPAAIFINTARGPIVDETAMVDALRQRRIAGAGLDVFDVEPLPAAHPLVSLDNVVMTPHCAGITPEVLEAGLAMALDNVTAFLAGEPRNVV